MTEDEAKTKWCPFVRLSVREDGNYRDTWAQTNRGEDVNCQNATNCMGSACMAWRRKHFPATIHRLNDDGSIAYSFSGDPEHFLGSAEHRVDPGFVGGFCGLAGATQ